jgi:hypothetical protein
MRNLITESNGRAGSSPLSDGKASHEARFEDISAVEYLLTSRNASEAFPGKEDIWRRLEQGQRTGRHFSRGLFMRAAAATAAAAVLMTTTVFADKLAIVFRQLRSGTLTYSSQDKVKSIYDGAELASSITFKNTKQLAKPNENGAYPMPDEYRRFDRLADAQEVSIFPLRLPAVIPDGMEYDCAYVLQAVDGTYMENASLVYKNVTAGMRGFTLSQHYVGPDSTIEIDAAEKPDTPPPVTVIVNGNEGRYGETAGLSWIQDGIFLNINGLSLEQALNVAQSIQ